MKKSSKYFFLIVVIILTTQFRSLGQTPHIPPYDSAYKIVFQDEFDSIYSRVPLIIVDSSKWNRLPGAGNYSNKTDTVISDTGDTCYIGWDKAYIISNDSDSTTVRISDGSLKLVVNDIDYLGEVWKWIPCDSLTDSTLTGRPCLYDSCIKRGNDVVNKCLTIDPLLFNYTTGALFSKPRFRYGYFEIRFMLPQPHPDSTFHGFGPNFWLFGADNSIGAYYSEIDIFEISSHNMHNGIINEYTSNAHWVNTLNFDTAYDGPKYLFNDTNGLQPNIWYTAACWWSPDFIKYYLNDTLIYEQLPHAISGIPPDSLSRMWIFLDINAPAFNYCTNFDSTTQFPYIYKIDYIKVYQRNDHCDSSVVYCNASQSAFESGLYQSLKIGGLGCVDSFSNHAYITGLGIDSVVLGEGFSIDATSNAYFDVQKCNTFQSAIKAPVPPTPQPPLEGIRRKYHYPQ